MKKQKNGSKECKEAKRRRQNTEDIFYLFHILSRSYQYAFNILAPLERPTVTVSCKPFALKCGGRYFY
jgi:hypothetical protein